MLKRFPAIIAVLILICAVYAASTVAATYRFFEMTPQPPLLGDKQRIVAVVPNAGNVDADSIRQEAEESGARYGAFVEFYEASTVDEQVQIIEIAVESGADGILLYPLEKNGFEDALSQCADSGIPVVAISQQPEDAVYDTFIGSGSDSERMAVQSCVSATDGEGNILIVDRLRSGGQLYMEAALLVPGQNDGSEGFPDLKTRVFDLANAPFEGYSVSEVMVMDENQSSSHAIYTEIFKLLETYRPDAVFSYDEDVTNVIAACLENALTLPDIYAIGRGNLEEFAGYLRRGTLDGLVQPNDAYAAFLAVRYLVALANGSVMPAQADAGIILISADNLERMLAGNVS